MGHSALSNDVQNCIQECLNCYRVCTEMAMNHCLETGGKHVKPHHFRLMMDCAEICDTAARFMMHNSDLHAKVCSVCAEVCEACAQSCREVGDMEDCVRACERCAESCRQMAQSQPGQRVASGARAKA